MASATSGPARGRRSSGRSNETIERYLPIAMVALVLVAGLVVLPSALRPPNQQPNQTAELSPDAPPDNNPQAIISALNRGASGVGGTNDIGATPGGAAPITTTTLPPEPPTTLVPRACPNGHGNPPRQTESIFAPACAAPFTGNNGGSTYKGVTATEIRIAVRGTNTRGSGDNCRDDYVIDDQDPTTMDAATRTFYVLEKYFNANFQFYGRQLKFICVTPTTLGVADEQANSEAMEDKWHVYGTPAGSSVACAELTRRHLISMCEGLSDSQYAAADPYEWSSYFGATEGSRVIAEYICKKLAGRNSQYAGPQQAGKPRKFGFITYNDRGYGAEGENLKEILKAQCGVDLVVIYMSPAGDSADGNAQLATASAQFSQAGVTTVIPAMDWVSTSALTSAAQGQGYFPEWLATDYGAVSQNQLGGLMNQSEWKNAFGFTSLDAQRPDNSTECFRAYHSIDPANAPNYIICNYLWRNMVLFFSAIQAAGPNLTPQTQKKGFYTLDAYWKTPSWALGGNYGPGKYAYAGDIMEIFWDPTATDPGGAHSVGAYRYIHNGARECPGSFTSEFIPFDDTDAPPLVPDYNSPAVGPPTKTCLEAHPPRQ